MSRRETLGARIRRERLGRTPPLTLSGLAGDQLSPGLVSKIERGLVSPSLQTLHHIAERLGLPLAELFTEDHGKASSTAASLHAARALLLLGDPETAARVALDAAGHIEAGDGTSTVPTAIRAARARLLGLAAEASLAAGNTTEAAQRLAEASRVLAAPSGAPTSAPSSRAGSIDATGSAGPAGPVAGSPGPASPGRQDGSADTDAAQAELAWVLGALERRRGNRQGAARSWGRALDLLEARRHASLGTALLLARVLADLGSLHESEGAHETARNFLTRALVVLAQVTDPAAAARRLLVDWTGPATVSAGSTMPVDAHPCPPEAAAAAGLAVVAAAARLSEKVAYDLGRLDRTVFSTPWPATSPPDVPHSRHLR
ncbi:MAG: helix-turn-helix domain-containing protein [Chloroflexi bacterium]|nr:helix-turn-helix domain-containing protein [Chloroflexota bacterium]